MRTVKVIAPAKVNLFLGIGARRDDGYHNATTVMHALSMHDTLQMTLVGPGEEAMLLEPGDTAQPMRQVLAKPESGSGLEVGANMVWAAGIDPVEVSDEANLVCRAVRALAAAAGRADDELVRVVVEKKIPHQTGLGGGSTDAAAALLGAASLWGIPVDSGLLEQVARELGADVAFFLHGGCALLEGTGDVFVHALAPSKQAVAIVRPAGGVSTAQAYSVFDGIGQTAPADMEEKARAAESAGDVPLFNNLAQASEQLHGQLAHVREFAASQPGVEGVLLCGSGAGTFAVCESYDAAASLSAAAQRNGWWARATSFSPLGASVLPG
ncbi:MAG: 4-(cytidine 5'-diphospho)-2-C-methyl-D-erythritol kinase [Eggerthellaceae bacterium]|nr:4-(cytidine 5'-diphospho)-2-C-methyl-D-erythritol kinase [Eggerthellaceae bacterium]